MDECVRLRCFDLELSCFWLIHSQVDLGPSSLGFSFFLPSGRVSMHVFFLFHFLL